VGQVHVGAGTNGFFIRASGDIFFGLGFPDVLGDNRDIVEVVVPFLIEAVFESKFEVGGIDDGDALQVIPNRGEPEGGILLAQFEGEFDVVGGQGLAIRPGEAFAQGHIIGIGVFPGSALGEPGGHLTGHGIVGEEELIHKTDGTGCVGKAAGLEGIPGGSRAPGRARDIEGLVAGVFGHCGGSFSGDGGFGGGLSGSFGRSFGNHRGIGGGIRDNGCRGGAG